MKRIILISFLFGLYTGFLQAQSETNKSPLAFRSSDSHEPFKPLIVIDDVVYNQDSIRFSADRIFKGEIELITFENIEVINILRNEAAVAQYGEKAKEGVMIITSKKTAWWQKPSSTK